MLEALGIPEKCKYSGVVFGRRVAFVRLVCDVGGVCVFFGFGFDGWFGICC